MAVLNPLTRRKFRPILLGVTTLYGGGDWVAKWITQVSGPDKTDVFSYENADESAGFRNRFQTWSL